MWVVALVWVVLAIFGAASFQELYDGTSGAQFFVAASVIVLIPTAIGLWAYRRSSS